MKPLQQLRTTPHLVCILCYIEYIQLFFTELLVIMHCVCLDTDCSSVSPSAPPLTSSPHQIIPFSEFELLSAIGLVGDSNGGGRKLGQGGFGTVYYCQLKINGTPTDAAVKVFSENVSVIVQS